MVHPLLQPIAALLAWSAIMFIWMYATCIPAMIKAGVDLKNRVGGQGKDLDAILPPEVQWKAHNYNHLMEQPTLFYAAALLLVLTDCQSMIALYAACLCRSARRPQPGPVDKQPHPLSLSPVPARLDCADHPDRFRGGVRYLKEVQ